MTRVVSMLLRGQSYQPVAPSDIAKSLVGLPHRSSYLFSGLVSCLEKEKGENCVNTSLIRVLSIGPLIY